MLYCAASVRSLPRSTFIFRDHPPPQSPRWPCSSHDLEIVKLFSPSKGNKFSSGWGTAGGRLPSGEDRGNGQGQETSRCVCRQKQVRAGLAHNDRNENVCFFSNVKDGRNGGPFDAPLSYDCCKLWLSAARRRPGGGVFTLRRISTPFLPRSWGGPALWRSTSATVQPTCTRWGAANSWEVIRLCIDFSSSS